MPVAALYDIHGNLPALEAVLAEMRQDGVDRIVVGGDVVLGPMTGDVLACLLDLDIPVQFIRGNCEGEVLAHLAGTDVGPLPADARATVGWEAEHLLPAHVHLIAGWPATLRLTIDGLGDALFCHATPRNDTEIFTRLTSEDRLAPVFAGLDVPLVVCGHTHMQFDRMVGQIRVVNAGSVGMPFGEPGADWLLLGPTVQLRHTPYDLAAAAARIRATPYPEAADFAARRVLQPAAEQEMLALFGRAELR
jgi:predicted phosphodiesterase